MAVPLGGMKTRSHQYADSHRRLQIQNPEVRQPASGFLVLGVAPSQNKIWVAGTATLPV